jgi:hypothetical protein
MTNEEIKNDISVNSRVKNIINETDLKLLIL